LLPLLLLRLGLKEISLSESAEAAMLFSGALHASSSRPSTRKTSYSAGHRPPAVLCPSP
jgi:hypothetical protein